jgi:uncharacterized protein YfaS (alpha-2-macroglobulin family)
MPNMALTLAYNPTAVSKPGTATLTGTLTGDGLCVTSKAITFYRSEGSSWIQLGTNTSTSNGVYSFIWVVPADFPSGFYRFRAVFSGDSEYPACSTENSSSFQVLPTVQLTVTFSPSTVYNAGTATLNGTLTTDGSAIPTKTINLFRSNGTAWVQIGVATSSTGGAYNYVWTVPIDLPSGNYCLRAEFGGDSTCSACFAETPSPGIEVLPAQSVPEIPFSIPIIILLAVTSLMIVKKRQVFRSEK